MLFEPLRLRDVVLRNRIVMSPMCQYSSDDGFASDWHLVHLGSRAIGGAALVMTEATAVEARGRISPQDLGIWKDAHIEGLARITRFVSEHGAVPGIQLAHAGRKAATARPWDGGKPLDAASGGWEPMGASAVAFDQGYPVPHEMTDADIAAVTGAFQEAARRALEAGFRVIELHAAHGYLLHEFLSPVSNRRTDGYGGSFENRCRFLLETVRAIRSVWPERWPLFVRISATDALAVPCWDLDQSIALARLLKDQAVDLIDCSSGGLAPGAKMSIGPGYQTPFAERIRRESGIATGAVGLITSAVQADTILRTGQADAVLIGRELLRDPYWPQHAAAELGAPVFRPPQYGRAG